MDSLGRAASELEIPARTLRRAASEGLVHGERLSPRRFRITFREEAYLRSHWELLRALRASFRTEPNVRLAVLFGSTAIGTDDERSDVDVAVVLHDPAVSRLAELTERLSRGTGREMQLIRLSEAETSTCAAYVSQRSTTRTGRGSGVASRPGRDGCSSGAREIRLPRDTLQTPVFAGLL